MHLPDKQHGIIVHPSRQLAGVFGGLPPMIAAAGEHAGRRFLEFFTANIRNRNTRLAYARAAARFFAWCDERQLALAQLEPMLIAAYVEQLGESLDRPNAKQHLAAIRMLFHGDWLVIGQVLPMNPASTVRGPRHVVKKGRTPVLSPDEARQLLDAIDTRTIAGLRDRALIGLMVYSFARVSAAIGMNTDDYFPWGRASGGGSVCTRRAASGTRCRHITMPKLTWTSTWPPPGSSPRSALPSSAPSTVTADSPIAACTASKP
jgi:integrase/recombinase XerD